MFENKRRGRLFERVASRDTAPDFARLHELLPDPDPVLRRMGKDISIYRELLCDPVVGGAAESRQSGVLSMPWALEPGNSPANAVALVQSALEALNLHDIITNVLEAPLFGMKVLEVVWKSTADAHWLPAAVDGLPQEWFAFDSENRLRFLAKGHPQGLDISAPAYVNKFLLARHKATLDNPYGQRVLSRVFWYVVFKRGGVRFWVTATEKYGMPWLFGKYRKEAGDAEKAKLLESLEELVQDGIGVLPEGDSIDTVDATTGGASAHLYERLVRFCDETISLALLGHTGAVLSTSGRLGSEKSALQVRQDLVDSDRRIVEGVLSKLARWIVDYNFGNDVPAPLVRLAHRETGLKTELARRDQVLSKLGVRFTRRYFTSKYGIPEDQILDSGESP